MIDIILIGTVVAFCIACLFLGFLAYVLIVAWFESGKDE